MKRRILFSVMMALLCLQTSAQNIKGKVFDETTNKPLQGATIKFAGKGGTTTDNNGEFFIDCNKNTSFTASYIGYATVKQSIKNCGDAINVGLASLNNQLNEVEITATSNTNKSLLYQPASITKLTPVELKRGNGLFLDDAINANVPGVTMNRRSVSGGQQLNIRGYGNGARGTRGISSNFDGQGYKVYLNGIPVTDAEGITTLDDIDFGSIGNVEVVKGPAGTLYGLAIAGAVNLKTVSPEKGKTSIGQEVLFCNYGLQRYTTTLQMGLSKSSVLANYGKQKSDGFAFHNKSQKDFFNLAANFNVSEKQTVNTYIGYSKSYDERLGELTLTQYNNNDYSGNITGYIARDAHSHVTTVRTGVGHTYAFTKNVSNTTTVFGTGFKSDASSAGGWTDKNTLNYGLRSTFDTKFELDKNVTLSGITGVEAQKQNGQTIGYSMKVSPFDLLTNPVTNPWVIGRPYYVINTASSNNDVVASTTSLFTEWTLALPSDLSITAGIGVSNQRLSLNDKFNTATITRPSQYDTNYKALVSPHFAINKVFNKKFSVYASYSKAYKAPVSSYFFITTPAVPVVSSRINSDLKPEIGNQFEIGTKGALLNDKLSYQLAYFNAIFSNKITSVSVPYNASTTLYSYVVNGGKQDHKGIEASLRYTAYESNKAFFTSIKPFANFTYSDFKYGSDFKFQTIGKSIVTPTKDSALTTDFSNKAVAGVAKFVGNFGVDITMRYGLYANINYQYKDKMPITSDGVLFANSYNLLNAKIGINRSLSKHFDID
ncbi:MAG: TonB-dependent receptor, partial [Ferruginibacter sp.]|nr:TonB-dependent receptor [Ferruginibacter sp.]